MTKIKFFFIMVLMFFLVACNRSTTTEQITTRAGDDAVTSALRVFLDDFFSTGYYSYTSESKLLYGDGSVSSITINTDLQAHNNRSSSENMFHIYSENSIKMGDVRITSDDVYFYFNEYGLNKASYHDYISDIYLYPSDFPKWLISFQSYEEQRENGLTKNINTFDLSSIVSEIDSIAYTETTTAYEFTIPLSDEFFCISLFPEFMATMEYANFIDWMGYSETVKLLQDRMDLITLTIQVNKDFTNILQVKIDWTDLMNDVFRSIDENVVEDVCSQVSIVATNWSNQSFSLSTPFFSEEYTDQSHFFYDIDGEVNDAYIDSVHQTIVYSLVDDSALYFFNYETYSTHKIDFAIRPDQITGDGEHIYVTLSDLHIRTAIEPQYGGLAVIDATDYRILHVFDLNFDPYDIVVDKDGFLYVTHGSNQHGFLRGIDPDTGAILSSKSGFYHLGQIVYSSYTDHLYYTEVSTTSDSLEVYDVLDGSLGGYHEGDEDFTEEDLTLTPDGRYLYSLDGKIFRLNPTLSEDGSIWDELDFCFNAVAFDLDNAITYFAKEDGIYAMSSSNQLLHIYPYALSSVRMTYTDGLLVNIGHSHIEIIDTTETETYRVDAYTTIQYGEVFDFEQYFDESGYANYAVTQLSGAIEDHTLGSFEFVFRLTNSNRTYDYHLRVDLVDTEGPNITLSPDVSFEPALHQAFTVPTCQVSDNYDLISSCEVVHNDVDSSAYGFYTITYRAEDASGNVTLQSYHFSIIPSETDYTIESYWFAGNITNAVYSEAEAALFYILQDTKEVVRYDFDTQTEWKLTFESTPERLLLQDGLVYVTIVHAEHSMYWMKEEQHGEIAIIDAATGNLESLHWVTVDPYSIVVIDDYLYIAPGSGQHVPIVAYKLTDFTVRRELLSFSYMTEIVTAPGSNRIFMISTQSSPQSLHRIDVLHGVLTNSIDDPGHGDYEYGEEIFQSADDLYVFNSYGEAFHQEAPVGGYSMDYAFDLHFPISAYCFDEEWLVSLFGEESGLVHMSNQGNLITAFELNVGYPVDEIFGGQSAFYVISYSESGLVFLSAKLSD